MSFIRFTSLCLALFLAVFLFSMTSFAKSHEESAILLKEALMESNGDYNKHKKKHNHEEMDRADEWNNRGESAIAIGSRMEELEESLDSNWDSESTRNNRDVSSKYEKTQ